VPLLRRSHSNGANGFLSTAGNATIGTGQWTHIAVNAGHTLTIQHGADVRTGNMEVYGAVVVQTAAVNGAGNGGAPRAENPSDESPEYDLLKVNINGLLRGHPEQNAAISPGDIINIPTTDVFFVSGEVRAPGTFPLREGTTLRQAIAMAQGTTFKAADSRGVIFREDPATGKREEVRIDIGAVMKGKKEDVPLLANDIVVVPNSRFRTVGSVFLTGFGTTAVTRLPIP